MKRTAPPTQASSPLYTSPAAKAAKAAVIAAKGRDLDGAYRATNRLDAQKEAA